MTLKQTILNDSHRALGAKMVDFGGWDMPIHYGSQIDEHHLVRRDAGMFDVSHMTVVDLRGERVREFLRHLLANSVDKLKVPGKALYSCMLNPQGGVIDDLIIYFFASDEWRVVVNAGTADKDIAWMLRVKQAGGFDVAITPRRDLAMVAVQGPNARAKVWAARPAWQAATEPLTPFVAAVVGDDTLVARTGYTGEDGFEIVLPATEVVQRSWPQSLDAVGTLVAVNGTDVTTESPGVIRTIRFESGQRVKKGDLLLQLDATAESATLASMEAARSCSPQGVSRPLIRITTSRRPNPPAATAAAAWSRACSLASGATASSRSRMTTSQGSSRAFSIARALTAGM